MERPWLTHYYYLSYEMGGLSHSLHFSAGEYEGPKSELAACARAGLQQCLLSLNDHETAFG
jgi:hypothetical protein